MDTFIEAVSHIIKEQQSIIGPVALDQAKKVAGLQISGTDDVKITGNRKEILGNLVNQYSKLFGRASIEVCKEAFEPYSNKIPASEVPDILKN